MDRLLGRARVAHELGVSERTASRWRRRGLLEVKQPGGRTSLWRVEKKSLEQAPSGESSLSSTGRIKS